MDAALITALLKQSGAVDTPENVNRIREFYASDPTALERRVYGVKGASDESGGSRDALLDGMLDKYIASTSAGPPVAVEKEDGTPIPQQGAGTAQPMPARSGGTAAPAYGPNAPQQYDYGAATPPVSGLEEMPTRGASDGSWDWNLLFPAILGMLGAGAGARYLNNKGPNVRAGGGDSNAASNRGGLPAETVETVAPNRNTRRGVSDTIDLNERSLGYEPKLNGPNAQGGTQQIPEQRKIEGRSDNYDYGSVGKEAETVMQRKNAAGKQRAAQIQDEVDLENRHAAALQEQIRQMIRNQENAGATARAGGRALRGIRK